MVLAKTLLSKTSFVAGLVCILASLGCAEKKKSLATEPVEGMVTLDGQPVAGATLTFMPVQDGVGAPATGMSDSQGKYVLTAVGSAAAGAKPGAGTLPGEYYVGVLKDEMPSTPGSKDPDYHPPAVKEAPTAPMVTHVVPQQFNDPKTSGVKVTVKSGKNDIPIKLESK